MGRTLHVTRVVAATAVAIALLVSPATGGQKADAARALKAQAISVSPASPTWVSADQGASGFGILFHVTDRAGRPVPGTAIAVTRSGLASATLSGATITTDASGDAVVDVLDTVAGETGTVTGTVGRLSAVSGTLTVTPGAPATLNFDCGGCITDTIVFNVQYAGEVQPFALSLIDAYGNLVSGTHTVTMTLWPSNFGGPGNDGGYLSIPGGASTGTDDQDQVTLEVPLTNGRGTFDYNAPTPLPYQGRGVLEFEPGSGEPSFAVTQPLKVVDQY